MLASQITPSSHERGSRDVDGSLVANTAADVLRHLDDLIRHGEMDSLEPLPSVFQPLDRYLEGGLRPGDLVLVGGAPGVGKTTLTLQMARNLVARTPCTCLYVCY